MQYYCKGKTGVEQREEGDKVRTGIQWLGDMKVKPMSLGFEEGLNGVNR